MMSVRAAVIVLCALIVDVNAANLGGYLRHSYWGSECVELTKGECSVVPARRFVSTPDVHLTAVRLSIESQFDTLGIQLAYSNGEVQTIGKPPTDEDFEHNRLLVLRPHEYIIQLRVNTDIHGKMTAISADTNYNTGIAVSTGAAIHTQDTLFPKDPDTMLLDHNYGLAGIVHKQYLSVHFSAMQAVFRPMDKTEEPVVRYSPFLGSPGLITQTSPEFVSDNNVHLMRITLWRSIPADYVTGIEMLYSNGVAHQFGNRERIWDQLSLSPGEFITRVSGRTAGRIHRLEFLTNYRRVLEVGDADGGVDFSVRAPVSDKWTLNRKCEADDGRTVVRSITGFVRGIEDCSFECTMNPDCDVWTHHDNLCVLMSGNADCQAVEQAGATWGASARWELIGLLGGLVSVGQGTKVTGLSFAWRAHSQEHVPLFPDESVGSHPGGDRVIKPDYQLMSTADIRYLRFRAPLLAFESVYDNQGENVTIHYGEVDNNAKIIEWGLKPDEFITSCAVGIGHSDIDPTVEAICSLTFGTNLGNSWTSPQFKKKPCTVLETVKYHPPSADFGVEWHIAGFEVEGDTANSRLLKFTRIHPLWRPVPRISTLEYSNMHFDNSNVIEIQDQDVQIATATTTNLSDKEQTTTVQEQYIYAEVTSMSDTVTQGFQWSMSETTTVSVSTTFGNKEAGFSATVSGSQSLSVSVGHSSSDARSTSVSHSTTRSKQLSFQMTTGPSSSTTASALAQWKKRSIPYTADVKISLYDGTTKVVQTSGVFVASTLDADVTYENKPLA